MKTLFLIRHAKSSWDDTALPDKDRPLGDRGRRDAPKMGKRLAKRDVKPDLILSSPARRALTTAEIIAKKLESARAASGHAAAAPTSAMNWRRFIRSPHRRARANCRRLLRRALSRCSY